MSGKTKYTDEPMGRLRIVDDFLPPPDQLAFRDETVKVTITLGKASVEFFKREAKRRGTPYQAMIRRLLDHYAQAYGPEPGAGGKPRRGRWSGGAEQPTPLRGSTSSFLASWRLGGSASFLAPRRFPEPEDQPRLPISSIG